MPTDRPTGPTAATGAGGLVVERLRAAVNGSLRAKRYVLINKAIARIDALEHELAEAREALGPFADVGVWLFARDLPDGTPVVEIEGIGNVRGALTRGHFKRAHTARQAPGGPPHDPR
jgi:hypothetical protein